MKKLLLDLILIPESIRIVHALKPLIHFCCRFTWDNNNWTAWSKYDGKYCCNDATEYDLWMCINNGGGPRIKQCGMHDGDVSQPHILLRSNRAYLCSTH